MKGFLEEVQVENRFESYFPNEICTRVVQEKLKEKNLKYLLNYTKYIS